MKKHHQVVITILSLFVFVFVANGDNCSFASNKKRNSKQGKTTVETGITEIEEIQDGIEEEADELNNSPEAFKAKMEEISKIREDFISKRSILENTQTSLKEQQETFKTELINLEQEREKETNPVQKKLIARQITNRVESLNVCKSYIARNKEIVAGLTSAIDDLLKLERKFNMDYQVLDSGEVIGRNNLIKELNVILQEYLPYNAKLADATQSENVTKTWQEIKTEVSKIKKEKARQAEIERQKKARLEVLERQVKEQEAKREAERREQEKSRNFKSLDDVIKYFGDWVKDEIVRIDSECNNYEQSFDDINKESKEYNGIVFHDLNNDTIPEFTISMGAGKITGAGQNCGAIIYIDYKNKKLKALYIGGFSPLMENGKVEPKIHKRMVNNWHVIGVVTEAHMGSCSSIESIMEFNPNSFEYEEVKTIKLGSAYWDGKCKDSDDMEQEGIKEQESKKEPEVNGRQNVIYQTWESLPPQEQEKNEIIEIQISHGNYTRVSELTFLRLRTARDLLKSQFIIDLSGIKYINLEVMQILAQGAGKDIVICLDGLNSLSLEIAQALAQWQGNMLSLNGLNSLSLKIAQALAQWQGENISLNGLTSLSPEATQALAQWQGETIRLDRLTSLNPETAQALAQWQGNDLWSGLTSLNSETAQALAQWQGETIRLDRLTSLNPETAQALAQWQGKYLWLHGLTSISSKTAQALAKYKGELHASWSLETVINQYK